MPAKQINNKDKLVTKPLFLPKVPHKNRENSTLEKIQGKKNNSAPRSTAIEICERSLSPFIPANAIAWTKTKVAATASIICFGQLIGSRKVKLTAIDDDISNKSEVDCFTKLSLLTLVIYHLT